MTALSVVTQISTCDSQIILLSNCADFCFKNQYNGFFSVGY